MKLILEKKLLLFFDAIRKKCFYLLGAGASAPTTPTNLAEALSKQYRQLGSFPITTPSIDERYRNLFENVPRLEWDEKDNELIIRPTNAFINDALQYLFASTQQKAASSCYIPQYDVFNLFHPSIIFNINHDGIAEQRCPKKHKVLTPHGKPNQNFGRKEIFEQIQKTHFLYDFSVLAINEDLCMLTSESNIILKSPPYQAAKELLPQSEYIIIIGYSFFNKNSRLLDQHTFDFFFNMQNNKKIPIIIISPDADKCDLVERIKECYKSNDVYGISMYWNCLSTAIMRNPKILNPKYWHIQTILNFLDQYYYYLRIYADNQWNEHICLSCQFKKFCNLSN